MPRRTTVFRTLLPLVAAALLAADAGAQRRPVTVDDQFRIDTVGSPEISPDGEWVLYTVSTIDVAADRRNTDLWLVKWDGSERTRLTYTAESQETDPQWSPDGRYISFLSARPGPAKGSQVWVLDRRGGEARQLTQVKGGVTAYAWSPDAKRLALVSRIGGDADNTTTPTPTTPVPPPTTAPAPAPGSTATPASSTSTSPATPAAPPKPIVIDGYQFKRDGATYLSGNARNRVLLFDVATQKADPLTADGDYEESGPAWSPDGTRIAFVSNHDEQWERTRNTDIFVIDATPGSRSRKLTTFAGADGGGGFGGRLAWSPDSRLIAYEQGSEPKFNFHSLSRLAIVPAAGGAPRVLTEALDRGVSVAGFTDDGKHVVVTVTDDRTVYLARVAVDGGALQRIIDGPRVVGQASYAKGRIAVTAGTSIAPAEIHAVDANSKTLRALSAHTEAVTKELQFQPAEDIAFASKDGTEIHALLTRPIGYAAGRRYPTLVRIHGGPTSQDAHAFNFERQFFAANGYVVVNVNYRGSSGRGAKFSEAIFADWGNLEVADVLAATDYLVAQGIADPDRLGIGGWSYGGVLTDYVIASDTRFKAAISGAGSANHISLYGHDQYTFLYDNEFGPPWKNVDLWVKFSYPFFKADRIRTPTLFMGGQEDFNVPILGSEQLYQALKTLNVPTQLVVYPGQNHGLTKVPFLRDRLERYLAWYDKYLKGDAPKATATGASAATASSVTAK